MKFSPIILSISLLLSLSACQELLIGDPVPNTIMDNYQTFVDDYADHYGIFQVKQVNWDSLAMEYEAQLSANATNAGLFNAITGLQGELNDSHIFLYAPDHDPVFYRSGIMGVLDRADYQDFDFELVLNQYLSLTDSVNDIIYYGTVENNLGYIYLPQIFDEPSFFEKQMPEILASLADTKGLIIDIRDNDGGEDESSRMIASFFADQRHLYAITRYKIGPGTDDFEPAREWYVSPNAEGTYSKPIVLLTNRFSISAGETFSLAMKTFPNVIQVGDTTTGAFSDVITRELPNGWIYGLSVGDYRDGNNMSLEGIGLAPDIRIVNTEAELQAGQDRMLERAIQELQ